MSNFFHFIVVTVHCYCVNVTNVTQSWGYSREMHVHYHSKFKIWNPVSERKPPFSIQPNIWCRCDDNVVNDYYWNWKRLIFIRISTYVQQTEDVSKVCTRSSTEQSKPAPTRIQGQAGGAGAQQCNWTKTSESVV